MLSLNKALEIIVNILCTFQTKFVFSFFFFTLRAQPRSCCPDVLRNTMQGISNHRLFLETVCEVCLKTSRY